ncbi:MAG: helix-turn-helix domain-containing protein [Candidatus Moraniibacteriota bacterium]
MLDIQQLKTLGLTEDEAKTYFACLLLGETTLAPLARKAEMPRSTVYLVLEQLTKKGLLSVIKKGKRNFYAVSSPGKIREIAFERKQKAEEELDLADAVSREVAKMMLGGTRPQVQYFYGRQGLRAIYEDLLSSGETADYYIGSTKAQMEAVGEKFFKDWIHRRVKAGIFSYAVRDRKEEMPERIHAQSRKMLREVRIAPKEFRSPLCLAVYGKRVALIASKTEKIGFIIESQDFAVTVKSLFDVLWAVSTAE